MVGVHSPKFTGEQDAAAARAAVQRLGIAHPVVHDPETRIWDAYAVGAWPTLIVLDPKGRVWAKHAGEIPSGDRSARATIAEGIARFAAEGLMRPGPLSLDPLPPGGAALRFPEGIHADLEHDRVFVADTGHHRVLEVGRDGTVRRVFGSGAAGFADGSAGAATFRWPRGMATDPAGEMLYVADSGNHAIRAVDLRDGSVRTVAGTGERGFVRATSGPARTTPLASPWDLLWRDGCLWVAMAGSHQVWTFDPAAGLVALAVGSGAEAIHDGPVLEAALAQPSGIAQIGGNLYLADTESSAVRRVDLGAGRVRRVVGRGLFVWGFADGRGDEALLEHPQGIAAVGDRLLLADTYNHALRWLDPATREVTTLAGNGAAGHQDGPLAAARFRGPTALASVGDEVWVADTDNHAVRAVDLAGAAVRTVDVR